MRWFYRCPECGAEYAIEPGRYLCDPCAARQEPDRPLRGVLECAWEGVYDGGPDDVPLPVAKEFLPPLPVGNTPLWEPHRLREETGFPRLFLKDDTCEPTGSFKDRASYLVAGFARERGITEIALASTGNAASSMSGVGAAAGLKITVFLPKKAPVAKRVQVLQYGAELREVDGTYDVAFDQSLAYSKATGVLSRNTAYNPLTIEGKKTVSFEIVRDLARAREHEAKRAGHLAELAKKDYVAPDHVFVPVGDGVIMAGVYKGFEDLRRLGRIQRVPTIWACQAEGSSAIARALESGGFGAPVASDTIADSISVDVPRNGEHALSKLRKHGGKAVVVTDAEILAAQKELATKAGLFAEPSSSASWAGFQKVRGALRPDETIVVMLTGSGLKDVAGAMKGLGLK
ncbi:MAG: pyridoxal-phosphate dependent enzyme [Spirochaetes bacterium]|nr:pyridoxal-phosphate dependent enzyme [Spirochaetota bacterium]MBU1081005.1 pyridoxal-phosphate dependent enzyme [Spirochaetota bacterium]